MQVMLDRDLAGLYQVPTKVLNQAVKRNSDRFPERFMFQLSKDELKDLRSQIVTSSYGGEGSMGSPGLSSERRSAAVRADSAADETRFAVSFYIRRRGCG